MRPDQNVITPERRRLVALEAAQLNELAPTPRDAAALRLAAAGTREQARALRERARRERRRATRLVARAQSVPAGVGSVGERPESRAQVVEIGQRARAPGP